MSIARTWFTWLAGSGIVLCAILAAPVSPAAAGAPTPALMAAWEHSDRLFAQSDLAGALRAIEPHFAEGRTLDVGPQRRWFGFSAARVLALVRRDAEANAWLADGARLDDIARRDVEAYNVAFGAAYDAALRANPEGVRRSDVPGYDPRFELAEDNGEISLDRYWNIAYATPGDEAVLMLSPTSRRNYCTLGGALNLGGSEVPGPAPSSVDNRRAATLRRTYLATTPSIGFLPDVPGGSTAASSYFGRSAWRRPGAASNRTLRLCNAFPVRRSGAATGLVSHSGNYAVTIPATSAIVTSRRVGLGVAIGVQVFAPKGKALIATWRPQRKGRKVVRHRYRISGTAMRIRAPKARGTYDLQIGVGRVGDVATAVSGVGVGVHAASAKQAPSGGAGRP